MSNIDNENINIPDEDTLEQLTTGLNYEKSRKKYEDNFSSAWCHLICGIAGYIFIVLNDCGILSFFNFRSPSGILMNILSFILFTIFFVLGIYHFKRAKIDKAKMIVEEDNRKEITEWIHDNITAEQIEASYDPLSLPDEMRFFYRNDYVCLRIKEQFPNLADDFIGNLAEEAISELFD